MKRLALLILACSLGLSICYASNTAKQTTKDKKKTTSQMTSKEIKQRDMLFKQCIQSGENRSKCYYMYY